LEIKCDFGRQGMDKIVILSALGVLKVCAANDVCILIGLDLPERCCDRSLSNVGIVDGS
jgi:hypothetical protein